MHDKRFLVSSAIRPGNRHFLVKKRAVELNSLCRIRDEMISSVAASFWKGAQQYRERKEGGMKERIMTNDDTRDDYQSSTCSEVLLRSITSSRPSLTYLLAPAGNGKKFLVLARKRLLGGQ